jgi:hypothetical protein
LTAAEIAELKREHAKTIEPLRIARMEILATESALSNLVNAAYGLNQEDVDLMWKSAPLRMPFTPTGLATSEQAGDEEED